MIRRNSSCQKPRRSGRERARDKDPFGKGFEGVIPNLRRRYEEGSWVVQEELDPFRTLRKCPACHGQRLKPQSLAVRVKGQGIADYVNLPISQALEVFDQFELTEREGLIATRVLREIRERVRFLHDVGVGYLTLNRSAVTLSGGEGQRIRLATQIGANLSGVLYVLDEPSDRPASARQPEAAVDALTPPRSRQHRSGGRARRGNDPHGRLRRRPRPRRGRARWPRDLPGHA